MNSIERRIHLYISRLGLRLSKRRYAMQSLIGIGEPAVMPLIQSLAEEDKFVRGASAKLLGIIGDERALEPLIAALADTRYCVREPVALALRRLDGERAIEALRQASVDESKWKHRPATDALRQLEKRVLSKTHVEIEQAEPQSLPATSQAETEQPQPKVETDLEFLLNQISESSLLPASLCFVDDVHAMKLTLGLAGPTESEIRKSLVSELQTRGLSVRPEPVSNKDFNDVCRTVFRIAVRSLERAVSGGLYSHGEANSGSSTIELKDQIISEVVECLLPTPSIPDSEHGRARKAPDTSYMYERWYNGT